MIEDYIALFRRRVFAPAIVRPESLMAVRSLDLTRRTFVTGLGAAVVGTGALMPINKLLVPSKPRICIGDSILQVADELGNWVDIGEVEGLCEFAGDVNAVMQFESMTGEVRKIKGYRDQGNVRFTLYGFLQDRLNERGPTNLRFRTGDQVMEMRGASIDSVRRNFGVDQLFKTEVEVSMSGAAPLLITNYEGDT